MIKFRAWDKIQNKMLLPDNIEFINGQAYWVEASTDGQDEHYNNGKVDGTGALLEGGISAMFELEQFTGLKDVNGKEIYENDIIHFGSIWCAGDECDPREEEHIGAVKYRTDCASYEVNCNGQIFPLMEVINFDGYSVQGNVHENPELLEEDK